jgi:hypothetical protein
MSEEGAMPSLVEKDLTSKELLLWSSLQCFLENAETKLDWAEVEILVLG